MGGSGSCGTTGTGGLYRDTITQVNATGATVVVAAGFVLVQRARRRAARLLP